MYLINVSAVCSHTLSQREEIKNKPDVKSEITVSLAAMIFRICQHTIAMRYTCTYKLK